MVMVDVVMLNGDVVQGDGGKEILELAMHGGFASVVVVNGMVASAHVNEVQERLVLRCVW